MIGSRPIGTRWPGSGRVQLDDYVRLEADLQASADLSASLSRERPIAAELSAEATLLADLSRLLSIGAEFVATADVDAPLQRGRRLRGEIRSTCELSAQTLRLRPISADFESEAALSGRLSRGIQVECGLLAGADLIGGPLNAKPLSAELSATADITGNVPKGKIIGADMTGIAALAGESRRGFLPSPAFRRLDVPLKGRRIPVNRKGRVVFFSGDDTALIEKRRMKAPGDVVDFQVRMDRWFRTIGTDSIQSIDVIASQGIDIGPGALPDSTILSATRFAVWVGGGEVGQQYQVTAVVTTARGRVEEIDLSVSIEEPTMQVRVKQPREVVDYTADMRRWFSEIGELDEVTDVSVEIDVQGDPDDLVSGPGTLPVWAPVGSPANEVKAWFGGGRDGQEYKVTLLITTDAGRVEEFSFILQVQQQ